jgi:hypothetical protein
MARSVFQINSRRLSRESAVTEDHRQTHPSRYHDQTCASLSLLCSDHSGEPLRV